MSAARIAVGPVSDWNPALYLRYAEERTRAAAELLARVPFTSAARVVDLGCGPGNSTELLVQRFPDARVLGIDHSSAMLSAAGERVPQAQFEQGDIAAWARGSDAERAPDLIYANAALHWVGDHARLLPQLMARLAPGGVLAVQMPDNLDEPSHRLMREVAQLPRFAPHFAGFDAGRTPLLAPEAYYDLLAPHATRIDVWRTTYQHALASCDAIVEWLLASGLKPWVQALPEALRDAYVGAWRERIDQAYPARADGRRLLAFPRLFFVAQRL